MQNTATISTQTDGTRAKDHVPSQCFAADSARPHYSICKQGHTATGTVYACVLMPNTTARLACMVSKLQVTMASAHKKRTTTKYITPVHMSASIGTVLY